MLTPKPKTAHHKRYHDAVAASQKKLDQKEKRISSKYREAVDPMQKRYREVQKSAYATKERETRPAERKYEATVQPVRDELRIVQKTAEDIRLRALRKVRREHSKVKKTALEKFQKATGSYWV